MDSILSGITKPKFRPQVAADIVDDKVKLCRGTVECIFTFPEENRIAVQGLIGHLRNGGSTVEKIVEDAGDIAEQVPQLLQNFDRLRLLVESGKEHGQTAISGAQLYREIRRLAQRVTNRTAKSRFYNLLKDDTATRAQIIGYALEYFWIVKSAPGLIGPALATAHSCHDRKLLQDFLKSELGHDRFLAKALLATGLGQDEIEQHQPLPSTFALCASLGVYARQHPLSFKATLFLFEQAQPRFVDAFDVRCEKLGLPKAFYHPLRVHADLNSDFNHADISRDLMKEVLVVSKEEATVVKRHVALMVDMLIWQENEILNHY